MIAPGVFIAPGAKVKGQVTIGPQSSVWFGSIIRADVDTITIGQGCNIQDGAILHVSRGFPVVLEDFVSVGHGAIVHGCYIEEGVLVGIGAILLDGVRVGRETVVGAGSLVLENTKLPPRCLVAGQPARVIRELSRAEIEKFRSTASRYIKYAQRYMKKEQK
ncbi:MAG: gamma carbonic anhydrase family protein [Firmicutes bacterium]|nr:gamma carbonic anhydrase family protein [Bacillota bacterium]